MRRVQHHHVLLLLLHLLNIDILLLLGSPAVELDQVIEEVQIFALLLLVITVLRRYCMRKEGGG